MKFHRILFCGNFKLMLRSLILFILYSTLSSTWAADKHDEQQTLVFGVFPYLSAARLEPIYSPVSAELTRELKHKVLFRTASRFERFFARLKQQYYDIALIQPFWYPPAVDQFSYVPLVRMAEPFTALIVVPDDSSLRTVDDLRGKLIATPPAFVPVVYMARRALYEKGVIPDEDVHLKAFRSVDSCFQQVFIGAADACISPPFAIAAIEKKMNIRLRVVMETTGIPNLSVVVHSRVPPAEREKIKKLFLSWKQHNSGKKLLNRMNTSGFVPAMDAEYDVVRQFLREIKDSK